MCDDLAQKRGDFFDSLFVSLFGSFGLNACEKDELILFVRKIKCADKYSYAVTFFISIIKSASSISDLDDFLIKIF